MSNNSEPKIRHIFLEAVEIENQQARAAFLDEACGAEGALRDRLEELLGADFSAGPPRDERLSASVCECAGSCIGRYKLLEQIGEGGCGLVFMAEQQEPVRRRVALKVIKLGMDTRQVVARFEAERQALALMDHPNIAKVLDAGATDSGRPYFVMELVRGRKITEYCDQHRLSAQQRLNLFIRVCHAVQHAHQKGIIHRDLKPSNILVTEVDGVPVPKVIDFGIAKAVEGRLTDHTLFTAFEQLLGTPAYMSPEQASLNSTDVDTRSDIYSLGVLLYELLTSRTPFDQKELLQAGFDAMRQTILQKPPPRPSTRLSTLAAVELAGIADARHSEAPRLIHTIRGDLDWIVMKCLEKERTRRYESASVLALDLQRYLVREPILARPPSAMYEFQMSVRRHWLGFGATLAVIVSLVGAVVISSLQTVRARRAEKAAETIALTERRTAYIAAMNNADQALRHGDLARTRALLRRYQPEPGKTDVRGWEWGRLAWDARGDTHISLAGHSNRVVCVRFLENDRLLSVGHGDQNVFIWKISQRAPEVHLTNRFQASEVDLLATQHRFYYSYWPSSSDTLRVVDWEAGSDVQATNFPMPFPQLCGVVCSRNEQVLAARSKHRVELLDLKNNRALGAVELGDAWANTVGLSPDGKWLAVGSDDGRLIWWNVAEHRIFGVHTNETAPKSVVYKLLFSPDSKHLLSVEDNFVRLWRVQDRTIERVMDFVQPALLLAFSPDGERVAVAREAADIDLFEVSTGKKMRTLHGHTDFVQAADFSPDGRQLASCSRNGEVKVWQLDAPPAVPMKMSVDSVYSGFAPDLSALFTVPTEKMQYSDIWSATNLGHLGRIRLEDLNYPLGTILPGGRTAALGDTSGAVLLRGEINRIIPNAHKGGLVRVVVSADGQKMISYGWGDGCLRVWRLPELELIKSAGGGGDSWCDYMDFWLAPNGRRLACYKGTGLLDIWDVPAMERIFTAKCLRPVENSKCTFSPDGRWLVLATDDAPPAILDLNHLERPWRTLDLPGGICPAAYSPDGTRLAVGTGDAVRLLDTVSYEQIGSLPIWDTRSLAFTPDGQCLVAVNTGSVTVFRSPPANELTFDWLRP